MHLPWVPTIDQRSSAHSSSKTDLVIRLTNVTTEDRRAKNFSVWKRLSSKCLETVIIGVLGRIWCANLGTQMLGVRSWALGLPVIISNESEYVKVVGSYFAHCQRTIAAPCVDLWDKYWLKDESLRLVDSMIKVVEALNNGVSCLGAIRLMGWAPRNSLSSLLG